MSERAETLRQFKFEWPALTATFMLTVVRWLLIGVSFAAAVWLVGVLRKRREAAAEEMELPS